MIVNQERRARDVIVVAASAGGLVPLQTLFRSLGSETPGSIAVVMHRSRFVDGQLLPVLRRASRVPVSEPIDGEPFEPGTIFLAPRDRHLLLNHGTFQLNRGPAQHHLRPAADLLFESAACAYGPRVVGVVLSGAGYDGALGCIAIKAAGGLVLTQDPEDATIPFMPMNALRIDHVDASLPLARIAEAITALAAGRQFEA